MLPLAKIPAAIPTRSQPDPKQTTLSLHLTDSQKMLLEFGLKPSAIVGDTLVFSKGISEKDLANMFSVDEKGTEENKPNAFYMRWKTTNPNQALRRAAFEFGPEDINSLLETSDAEINSQDNNPQKKYTALHIALQQNKTENALYLLKKGARYDINDAKGQTALAYALENSIMPILLLVSTQIMSAYHVDDKAKALRIAANNDNLTNLRVMLKLGVEVNQVGETKMTALHYAARSGNENIVDFLLKNGANAALKDSKGKTALNYATTTRIKNLLAQQQIKSESTKMSA